MTDMNWAMGFMVLGLINGLFAMATGSIVFGAFGLLFAMGGYYIIFR